MRRRWLDENGINLSYGGLYQDRPLYHHPTEHLPCARSTARPPGFQHFKCNNSQRQPLLGVLLKVFATKPRLGHHGRLQGHYERDRGQNHHLQS